MYCEYHDEQFFVLVINDVTCDLHKVFFALVWVTYGIR